MNFYTNIEFTKIKQTVISKLCIMVPLQLSKDLIEQVIFNVIYTYIHHSSTQSLSKSRRTAACRGTPVENHRFNFITSPVNKQQYRTSITLSSGLINLLMQVWIWGFTTRFARSGHLQVTFQSILIQLSRFSTDCSPHIVIAWLCTLIKNMVTASSIHFGIGSNVTWDWPLWSKHVVKLYIPTSISKLINTDARRDWCVACWRTKLQGAYLTLQGCWDL